MSQRVLKKIISSVLVMTVVSMLSPSQASAEPTKEFILSCTYGVIAGTLVGAASLAFTSQPGENLNYIARGASLGLYAGILLGLYVVYGVPSGASEAPPPTEEQEAPPAEEGASFHPQIFPIISERGNFEGGAFSIGYKF